MTTAMVDRAEAVAEIKLSLEFAAVDFDASVRALAKAILSMGNRGNLEWLQIDTYLNGIESRGGDFSDAVPAIREFLEA